MPDAVLDRLVKSYMATSQPVYTFGWQGGEPLLMGADFLKKLPTSRSGSVKKVMW
jgi:uncharacterized protein